MNYDFLYGSDLKNRILEHLRGCRQIVVISAYVTSSAVDWLASNIAQHDGPVRVTFLGRFTPSDLASGSSDIGALRSICSHGWDLLALSNLHAKIYLFDETRVIVGSGNWTNNGLKLCGTGNEEAAIDAPTDAKTLDFIRSLLHKATRLDAEVVEKMADFLNGLQGGAEDELDEWPDDILQAESDLYVADFPFSPAGYPSQLYHDNPQLTFSRISRARPSEGHALFIKSKAYRWIKMQLQATATGELYFGELSSRLHDALSDSPAPYRKEVKDLLANLLTFLSYFEVSEIIVDRPNYSQRVRLVR